MKKLKSKFDRRINLKLEMPMPGMVQRAEIWRRHFSSRTPLAEDVDFEALGKEFEMAGGNIKNAVLNAVRMAAHGELDVVDMACLRVAAGIEAENTRSCQFECEEYDKALRIARVKGLMKNNTSGYQ